MSFLHQTGSAVRWAGSVLGHFLRERLFSTLSFAFCIVGVQITTLLSFFLPLKILILAGSEGVPKYFRFFMDPSEKDFWILALSLGAIGFYLASLILDRFGHHLSRTASAGILSGANEVAVTTQLREDAKGFYAQFVGMLADIAVFLLGLGVISIIHWPLAAILIGLVVFEFIVVAAISVGKRGGVRGHLWQWVTEHIGEVLNILYAVNFLGAFFALLAHFVLGPGMNILAAILTILILRQGLKGAVSTVTTLRALWLTRPRIDPLVFRSALVEARDRPVGREFREVFARGIRGNRVESALAGASVRLSEDGVRFRDVAGKNVFLFELFGEKAGGDWFGLQNVFSQDRVNLLEHEEFLFEFISRSEVFAPPVVSRYVESGFYCQIIECGPHGEAVEFSGNVEGMLSDLWSLRPPPSLIDAYHTSHRTLEGRLTELFLMRAEVAADDRHREKLLERFLSRREVVCQAIEAVPLHIMNPDANPHHLIMGSERRPIFRNWQRWSIEHLGAFVPGKVDSKMLERILCRVREKHGYVEAELNLNHVDLVGSALALEKAIVTDQFCSSFGHMKRVLQNPLVAE